MYRSFLSLPMVTYSSFTETQHNSSNTFVLSYKGLLFYCQSPVVSEILEFYIKLPLSFFKFFRMDPFYFYQNTFLYPFRLNVYLLLLSVYFTKLPFSLF